MRFVLFILPPASKISAEEGEAELGIAMCTMLTYVGRSDLISFDISVTLEAKRMVEPVA